MALRWEPYSETEGWAAWAPIAWDGSDVEVGAVTRVRRHDESGWRARYWGMDDAVRSGTLLGRDRTQVGGLWATSDEAKAAVEEAHLGPSSCEEGPWD